jgi:hypothetical protein
VLADLLAGSDLPVRGVADRIADPWGERRLTDPSGTTASGQSESTCSSRQGQPNRAWNVGCSRRRCCTPTATPSTSPFERAELWASAARRVTGSIAAVSDRRTYSAAGNRSTGPAAPPPRASARRAARDRLGHGDGFDRGTFAGAARRAGRGWALRLLHEWAVGPRGVLRPRSAPPRETTDDLSQQCWSRPCSRGSVLVVHVRADPCWRAGPSKIHQLAKPGARRRVD